jgi:alpha-beta hydrolase superfamily lysophospholipase
MNTDTFRLPVANDTELFVYQWIPEQKEPYLGVIQIAHGMVEHAGRYTAFAEVLTRAGWVVVADDHRGHGKTRKSDVDSGFFAEKNGWDLVVDDLFTLTRHIRQKYPDLPLVLFGHSMGSFLARNLMFSHGEHYAGVILSATGGGSTTFIETSAGSIIATLIAAFKGIRHRSKLITTMVFGPYNKKIKPVRTEFDWLSREDDEVDKYMNDPACGFFCTTGFYKDLFKGVRKVSSRKNIDRHPKDMPVLFIAGEADPVGKYGNGVRWVIKRFKDAGMTRVQEHFYPEGRHEVLNDTQREEAYADILSWLKPLGKTSS